MNRKVGKMALRGEVESHLAALLMVDRFKDYGPNGLQVEGKPEVLRLVSGVTASLALIEAARPMLPDSSAASSERMSPYMFVVTTTS